MLANVPGDAPCLKVSAALQSWLECSHRCLPRRGDAANEPVPKCDTSTEAVFQDTVDEVRDRQCPVSARTGSHRMLKQTDLTRAGKPGW